MVSCQYAGWSIQNKRAVNMDSVGLKEREIGSQMVYLAVVCDGVGSMRDGSYASSRAVKLLCHWIDQIENTDRLGLRLRDEVLRINRQIIEEANLRGLRTATTLSALLVYQDNYYVVHIGDSRIYRLHNDELVQLTWDQVRDNKLFSCLGWMDNPDVIYNEGLATDCKFLLCSDGIHKKTPDEVIYEALRMVTGKNMKKVVEQLSEYAANCGETDNISVAIMKCESKR